jgi:hypothetical protein
MRATSTREDAPSSAKMFRTLLGERVWYLPRWLEWGERDVAPAGGTAAAEHVLEGALR